MNTFDKKHRWVQEDSQTKKEEDRQEGADVKKC